MTHQSTRLGRWITACALFVGAVAALPVVRAQVAPAPQQQIATADELKVKAFEALRAGKFDVTNNYLSKAAEISKDPVLEKMANWTRQFEQQRQVFVSERHREYEKAVSEIHLLMEKQKEVNAMEIAARAYLLSEDKDAFRTEPWMVKLLNDAKKLASDSERNEQWLKSLRLYSQLSAIEPEVPEWKERLKTSTRRIRLLMLYTPDELKKVQEADAKEREEVESLLHPTTRPTTKPAEEEPENQARVDWRETLRDVRMDMLTTALRNARTNYYRDVSYDRMIEGGLSGLRIVLTTPALEKAFTGSDLADAAKRAQFIGVLDGAMTRAAVVKDQDGMENLLRDLKESNERTVKIPEAVLVSEFADGAFAVLDPFSNIIWPSDWEEFQKTTKGEFSGVGIQIQTDDSGNLKVVSPLEDSPAYRAGIKPEYIITHIDGKSARWITLNQAVKRITGPPGTKVTLTVKDTRGQSKDYTLQRDTIKVASVKGWLHRPGGGWDYMIDPEQKIGYLRLTNFTKTTSDDLEKAAEDLAKAGAQGVIFDLRYNPGGLLTAATEVVDKFIDRGIIVSTRPDRADSPNAPTVMSARNTGAAVKLPLIVLVNQYSASASEIVAGALKDHHRAVIVGERTFGKGSVQMLYPLSNQMAVLKLTTSHYYLPNGKCIHREENSKEWGVDPDVTVEMTPEQMRSSIDARQEFDILRDADPSPTKVEDLPARAGSIEIAVKSARKDPLGSDAQLSAALLLMRLQLAGGDHLWAQAAR